MMKGNGKVQREAKHRGFIDHQGRNIPEMWKDSHRELEMEKCHQLKPDLCREIWQDVVLLVLPCCALQYQKPELSRGKEKR